MMLTLEFVFAKLMSTKQSTSNPAPIYELKFSLNEFTRVGEQNDVIL